MSYVIRIMCAAIGPITPDDGRYLESYNPHQGKHGVFTTTADLQQAMVFAGVVEARDCYVQINQSHPRRPDGQPNRPLTAYTVELVELKV